MTIINLDGLLKPKSIALIGPNYLGEVELSSLLERIADSGYVSPVTLVGFEDPHGAFSEADSLDDMDQMPDLAVLACGPERAAETIAKLGAGGTRAAVMIAPGFEAWPRETLKEMLEAARPYNLRLVGPGSLGIASPSHRLQVHLSVESVPGGDLAMVSRSGIIMNATLGWASAHGVGFSHVVSLGDRADVDIADLLDWFTGDVETRAIMVQLEAITNARKFLSAARAAARAKPVVLIRTGASTDAPGKALTNAGRLATTDAVYDAALMRAGVLRVGGLDDMFDAAETVTRVHPNLGRRLAIIANSRSLATLATDRIADLGGEIAQISAVTEEAVQPLLRSWVQPENPLIIPSNAPPETYTQLIKLLLADRNVDGIVVVSAPTAFANSSATAAGIIAAAGRQLGQPRAKKAVIAALATADPAPTRQLEAAGIPCYRTSAEAVRAFMYVARYTEAKKLLMANPPSLPADFTPQTEVARAIVANVLAEPRTWLETSECRDVLAAYDIATGPAPAIPRKAGSKIPGELFAGLADDPTFGPVIVFGPGGSAVDYANDYGLDLAPLDLNLAEALIARTRISRLFRDADENEQSRRIRHGIALVLVKLAQLAVDIPEIREIDLNPFYVDADGNVTVTDMRIAAAPPNIVPGRLATSRLAIRPYPKEWERTVELKDGRRFFVRPVRPDDEDSFKAFFQTVSAEDLRLRFFAPVRDFSHAFLARLTQLDYSRAMAFAAFDASTGEMMGAVRLHADPDHRTGEYAIMVRSELKGQGLGWMLMNLIIDYAARDGIETITGEVLKENTTMLDMCRSLGFRIRPSSDDEAVSVVTLSVAEAQTDATML
ncbi:GNAT family N-acetyltransferase [Breoghania sp. JC706]|uniref:bifunctional acetate--CoA ligase family protein/GNAT family N-acetyltransferase n=1 Tax=Breoghania sp. JC706 TaxID=3117732 RepID=UPI00300A4D19